MASNGRKALLSLAVAAVFAAVALQWSTPIFATTLISDNFTTSGPGGLLLDQPPNIGPANGSVWGTHGMQPVNGLTTICTLTSSEQPVIDTSSGVMTVPYSIVGAQVPGLNVDGSLAFTPATSGMLALTSSFDTSSIGTWAYMGFANSAATADPWVQASLYVLVTPNSTTSSTSQKFILGTGPVGSTGSQLYEGYNSTTTLNAPIPYTITYDPTTLQAALYINGGSTAAFTTTLSNPLAIGSIFLGARGSMAANFSDVVLTQQAASGTTTTTSNTPVPEPATLGLVAVGAIGLLLRNRAKQRMA